jgi:hypothetical protein
MVSVTVGMGREGRHWSLAMVVVKVVVDGRGGESCRRCRWGVVAAGMVTSCGLDKSGCAQMKMKCEMVAKITFKWRTVNYPNNK